MGRDSAAAVILGPMVTEHETAGYDNFWRLARARVNERVNKAQAIADYSYLERQWRGADETFQDRLAEVRAALRRLRADLH
jgi:hypothetical protein